MADRATVRSTSSALLLSLSLLATAAAAQTTTARDTVVLANGTELRGRIVRADDTMVILRIGSRDREIARAEIRSLQSVAAAHRDLLAVWQTTGADDVPALLALATRADGLGLPHEARLLRWYAALRQPGDAAIHAALGNKRHGDTFLVEIDGRQMPFATADALGVDFDDAWRLRSEHFTIRCAAGLRTGLDTLFELEGLYHAFHALFDRDLRLLELVEPIDVHLYRDRAQMPNLSNTRGAWFDQDERVLYTCMEDGRPFALVHEATHALLHFFFVRAAKSRGDLPAWLDEGWADYLQGRVLVPTPGKVSVQDRSALADRRAALADAARRDDLYSVHRLLNFKSSDFGASTRQDTKYAQAWALFRYLFESDDAQRKGLFADYLRDATQGRGQASTFRRLFARHERQLETEPWQG